jgi:hypothetical protein
VFLQTSNDWEKWFTRLKDLSERKRVWNYFDPDLVDGPTLEQPTPLMVDLTLATINAARYEEY